jgi:hypothetical protein
MELLRKLNISCSGYGKSYRLGFGNAKTKTAEFLQVSLHFSIDLHSPFSMYLVLFQTYLTDIEKSNFYFSINSYNLNLNLPICRFYKKVS